MSVAVRAAAEKVGGGGAQRLRRSIFFEAKVGGMDYPSDAEGARKNNGESVGGESPGAGWAAALQPAQVDTEASAVRTLNFGNNCVEFFSKPECSSAGLCTNCVRLYGLTSVGHGV